jgi:hypothetical protein
MPTLSPRAQENRHIKTRIGAPLSTTNFQIWKVPCSFPFALCTILGEWAILEGLSLVSCRYMVPTIQSPDHGDSDVDRAAFLWTLTYSF